MAYICEVTTSDHPMYSSSCCVCTFTSSNAPAANHMHNCTNCTLYPFRKYSITVQCENSVGIGNSTKIISI